MKKPKLKPEVFETAAKVVGTLGCCSAIAKAMSDFRSRGEVTSNGGDHSCFFGSHFMPHYINDHRPAWWMEFEIVKGEYCNLLREDASDKERDRALAMIQNRRVIALLLCAEMVRDANRRVRK